MATWATIVDTCSIALADAGNAEFSDEEIAQWLNLGVQDYSQYFPRNLVTGLSTSAADQQYDLAANTLAVLMVEYPTGSTPPTYLSRLPRNSPLFSQSTIYYDILWHTDDTDVAEIIVSASPAASETITVTYSTVHDPIANPASISGSTTVPDHHLHLLVKFVQWQATVQLMFAEQISPTSGSSLLMAQLSQNARRMENGYHTALRQALYVADGEGIIHNWTGAESYSSQNSLGRIY